MARRSENEQLAGPSIVASSPSRPISTRSGACPGTAPRPGIDPSESLVIQFSQSNARRPLPQRLALSLRFRERYE